jgi:hypothetical protein
MHAYRIQSELPERSVQDVAATLPEDLRELIGFLQGASRLGSQVAFWRSKGRHQLLDSAAGTLRCEILSFDPTEKPDQETAANLRAYEGLLNSLDRLIQSIPFDNKVGVLRRNLIATYQQVYILRHLSHGMVCRLRMRMALCEPQPVSESQVAIETLRELRKRFSKAVPSWDRESWNVYDHF